MKLVWPCKLFSSLIHIKNKLGQSKHICLDFPRKNIFQWCRDCVLRRTVQKFIWNVSIQGRSEQLLFTFYRIYTKYTMSLYSTNIVAMKIVTGSTPSRSCYNPTLKLYISRAERYCSGSKIDLTLRYGKYLSLSRITAFPFWTTLHVICFNSLFSNKYFCLQLLVVTRHSKRRFCLHCSPQCPNITSRFHPLKSFHMLAYES